MEQRGVFLTAEWRNLLMLNYAVDPALLLPFVPAGTALDSFEGRTYVSLVAFEFNEVRVAGLSIPFHRSFEEVNLRFYVRRADRRGVVFIRELVPKFAVAAVARAFFGENYRSTPMRHAVARLPGGAVEAEFGWGRQSQQASMRIETEPQASIPAEGSLGQFITEHYWGYAAQRNDGCIEYEVRHPRWMVREARQASFTGDAANYYGAEFGKILLGVPDSAFLAEGSPVEVFKGTRIL